MTEEEIADLARILEEHYPNVTEYILREIYDNRSARFVQFIKHILGIEPLATFTETVSFAFDEYIRKHNNYGQIQIQFLFTLKSFVLQKGTVEKRDLVNAPFTQIHPQGIRGIFKPNEIEEILRFTEKIDIQKEGPDMAEKNDSQLVIYKTEAGDIKIDVRFQNETVWLSQQLMAELFQTTKAKHKPSYCKHL